MIDPKVVFEPVLGRWRVEYRTQWTDEWQTHRYHHTLEEAREVAQRQVVEAYNAGVSKVDIHRATGRARATIDLWLRLEDQAETNRSNR